jgi:hypothetical protein
MLNESVNKLIFTYVNTRSLRRARRVEQRESAKAARKIFAEPLIEKEEVEDTLLEMQDSMLIHAFYTENTVLGKREEASGRLASEPGGTVINLMRMLGVPSKGSYKK